MKRIFYCCDGEKKCGKDKGCFKNGGECQHTKDAKHARYKDKDIWEKVERDHDIL